MKERELEFVVDAEDIVSQLKHVSHARDVEFSKLVCEFNENDYVIGDPLIALGVIMDKYLFDDYQLVTKQYS